MPWPKSPGYTDPDRDAAGYRIVTLRPGEVHDQPVAITRAEIQRELRRHPELRALSLSWAFASDSRDVAFGVYFNDGFDADYRQADLKCLKPTARYDAHVQEVRKA